MLLIPAPTRGATALDVLVTDADRVDVPTITPEFADRLLERWLGATEHEHDGQRWLHLPLHVRTVNEAVVA